MPVEYTGKLKTSSGSEFFSAVGGWPGDSVNFACMMNRGRSVLGRACFKMAFPEVPNVTSFAVTQKAKELFEGKPLDVDVKSVLEEYGYPTDDEFTYMGDVPINSKAVSIYFVDRFKREWADREWSIYRQTINSGQILVCIPIEDPPVNLVPPEARRELVLKTFLQIQKIVFLYLKPVVTDILNGEYKLIDGVYYPFGQPKHNGDLSRISTFAYLRNTFGWTGDIG